MMNSTKTLISALKTLANDVQSEDGAANATIAEAADRLSELTHDQYEPLKSTDDRFWLLVGKLGALSDYALEWFRDALSVLCNDQPICSDRRAITECIRVGLVDFRNGEGDEINLDPDAVTLWARCPHLFPGG